MRSVPVKDLGKCRLTSPGRGGTVHMSGNKALAASGTDPYDQASYLPGDREYDMGGTFTQQTGHAPTCSWLRRPYQKKLAMDGD